MGHELIDLGIPLCDRAAGERDRFAIVRLHEPSRDLTILRDVTQKRIRLRRVRLRNERGPPISIPQIVREIIFRDRCDVGSQENFVVELLLQRSHAGLDADADVRPTQLFPIDEETLAVRVRLLHTADITLIIDVGACQVHVLS